jgi:predicted Zn-dependent peptidase
MALYELGLDYLERVPSLIEAITPAQVQAAARAHLHPEAATIVVAGPPAAA